MNYLIRNQWSVKEIKRYECAREECVRIWDKSMGWKEERKKEMKMKTRDCFSVIMCGTCVRRHFL